MNGEVRKIREKVREGGSEEVHACHERTSALYMIEEVLNNS